MTDRTDTAQVSQPSIGAYWRSRQWGRGVSMLFFLMAIPVLFAFAALAIDFTRILEAHRSLEQAAEEAAQSGAMSYNLTSGTPQIVPTQARNEAMRNFNIAVSRGVVTAARPSMTVVQASQSQITVEATGFVENLIFLRYFQLVQGDGSWEVTAQGVARVCLAGFAGEQACTRPDGR